MNWRDAYLTQAWSDFQVFREMTKSRYPTCHALHYLQMSTEKLAKGFLSKESGGPPKRTPYLLITFLNVSRSQRNWREKLGYGQNPKAYGYYIDSLLPVAEQIENLVPEPTFNRINAEYPWINEKGEVGCPCKCDFSHIDTTSLAHFRKLVHHLFYIIGFRD
jgi:hypothetical protein